MAGKDNLKKHLEKEKAPIHAFIWALYNIVSKSFWTRCVCETWMPQQWPFFENCDLDTGIWPWLWQMILTLIPKKERSYHVEHGRSVSYHCKLITNVKVFLRTNNVTAKQSNRRTNRAKTICSLTYRCGDAPPRSLSGEHVRLMTWWCEFKTPLRRNFFLAYFRLSPLLKNVRKLVSGFGKKVVLVLVWESQETCASLTAMIWP